MKKIEMTSDRKLDEKKSNPIKKLSNEKIDNGIRSKKLSIEKIENDIRLKIR